ncbi:predicted protein [Botrytis cinerea T4]|uniref:Uncharacterized protein n=1 Tax=Botryotinia fuckeliana (strain T4) TaxID=999810 RepID=G2YMW6_BOTF4|nr:predicted protein [Botrytis cinerea T4]
MDLQSCIYSLYDSGNLNQNSYGIRLLPKEVCYRVWCAFRLCICATFDENESSSSPEFQLPEAYHVPVGEITNKNPLDVLPASCFLLPAHNFKYDINAPLPLIAVG